MTTDGKESTFTTSGAEVKATAKWEGNALVIVSSVPVVGIAYNDRMTLSPDGKLLTSVVRRIPPREHSNSRSCSINSELLSG